MIIERIFSKINTVKFHNYYFLAPHAYAVGVAAMEIYFGIIKAQLEGRKLILLSVLDVPLITGYKFSNRALFQLRSDYIRHLPWYVMLVLRLLLTSVYLPTRLVFSILRIWFGIKLPDAYSHPRIGAWPELYVPSPSVHRFDWNSVESVDWRKCFLQKRPVVLAESEDAECQAILRDMGISDCDWFVCFHVREGGFKQDGDRRGYRNSDIDHYIPAIKAITDQGGWVIRLGDATMKALPRMSSVIDYPHSTYQKDLMEIYLILSCRFFVATQSGIFDVARLANKKILMTNMHQWPSGGLHHEYGRGILKHVYSKRDSRFLSVKEIFSGERKHIELARRSLTVSSDSLFPGNDNYSYHENTSEEIKDAVIEYMDSVNSNYFIKTELQNEFDRLYFDQNSSLLRSYRVVSKNLMNDEEEWIHRYMLAANLHGLGTLCQGFLDSNWIQNSRN